MPTTKNLWDNYNGKGFAAEYSKYSVRASKDEAGQDIHSTLVNLDSRTSVIPDGEASATSSLTVTNSGSTWANWAEGDFEIPAAHKLMYFTNFKNFNTETNVDTPDIGNDSDWTTTAQQYTPSSLTYNGVQYSALKAVYGNNYRGPSISLGDVSNFDVVSLEMLVRWVMNRGDFGLEFGSTIQTAHFGVGGWGSAVNPLSQGPLIYSDSSTYTLYNDTRVSSGVSTATKIAENLNGISAHYATVFDKPNGYVYLYVNGTLRVRNKVNINGLSNFTIRADCSNSNEELYITNVALYNYNRASADWSTYPVDV